MTAEEKRLHMLGRVTSTPPTLDDMYVDQEVEHASVAHRFVNDYLNDHPGQKSTLIHPKIRSVLSLYLFNRIRARPSMSFDEKEALVTHLYKKLFHAESHALLLGKYVPTIGLEIEIEEGRKKYNRNDRSQAILKTLGFRHHRARNEYLGSQSDELEVKEWHSYSAATQARLAHELSVLGTLRTVQLSRKRKRELKNAHIGIDRKKRQILNARVVHSSRSMYSLHVNFGLPDVHYTRNARGEQIDWLYPNQLLEEGVQRFSYIAMAAFSSKERLQRRKTKCAHHLGTSPYFDGQKRASYRLELRGLEVRDYPTYRMLYELQLLAGCMTAATQRDRFGGLESEEHALALVWERLCADVRVTMVLDMASANAADDAPRNFIDAVCDGDTQQTMRSVVQEYALQAKRILERGSV